MNSPQNEVFTKIRTVLEEAYPGIVYDGRLPAPETSYPFIYIRNTSLAVNLGVKYHPLGSVAVHVDIWHNDPGLRGTLSEMLYAVERLLFDIKDTASYRIYLADMQAEIVTDNTTSMPLLHGYIDATYNLLGGK